MSDTSDSLDAPDVSAPRNERPEATPASNPAVTATFATWNVFSAKNYDGKGRHFNKSGFVESIRQIDADVVGLQEVDHGMIRTRWHNLAKLAGRVSEYSWYFGRVRRRFDLGLYGNALLTAPLVRVIQRRAVLLPRHGRNEKRGAVIADVVVAAKHWQVATTHLSNDKAESRAQLEWLLDEMSNDLPVVVMGDMNRQESEIDEVLQSRPGWTAVETPHTWSSTEPRRCIDWVLIRNADSISCDVRSLHVSDHRLVSVELRARKSPLRTE